GREADALRAAEAVAASAPADVAADARLLCATLTLRAHRLDDALAHLDAARAAGRTDAELEESAGRTLFVREDYAAAAERLTRASRGATGDDPELLELLASARIRSGDLPGAREAIVAYIELRSVDDAARTLVADWRRAKARGASGR
ncbi:MAG: hypothetical protein AAGI22_14675, partial [Planctomycetota bacterium]